MTDSEKKKLQAEDDIALRCIKKFEKMRSDRGNFESHCQEVAERFWPNQSRAFNGQLESGTEGERRTEKMLDSQPLVALGRFVNICDSLLTPMTQTWHKVTVSNPYLAKDRQVQLYFDEYTRVLFKLRYSPKANFAGQNQLNYKFIGAFGNGCVFVDKLKGLAGERGLRYRQIRIAESFFAENHQGMVDTVIRYFKLTARQAKQMFPSGLPKSILDAANDKPDSDFWFIHVVEPRREGDYDPERRDHKSMPFVSYYVSITDKKLVEEGGFRTMPYAVSRYEQSGEVYGRSPAMDALPATKTLNAQKATVLKQGHRTVDPVLLAHDDGVLDAFSLRPGAINYGGVSADGRPLVHALPVGNIAVGKDLMDDERKVIDDSFFVTLFQILMETPQMTATEVMERLREKGILMAPTMGRIQAEYLGSLIEREVDIVSSIAYEDKALWLPPMPQILLEAKGEYTIEYDSPFSRSQRAEEAAGLMRALETALNFATQAQDPSALDHFNIDEIIPDMASIQGLPARWMNTADKVAQIRSGRAQMMETQQAIQAAPGVAAITKANAQASTRKLRAVG